jgi:hypothetical protein
MKSIACILVASLVFAGCNNSQREAQLKALAAKDSTLFEQTQQKDSTIMAYIHSLNDIQDNLNAIKTKEKVISMGKEKGEGTSQSGTIVADIKTLDELIVKNHRELNALEKKLRAATKQDEEIKKMVANLQSDLKDKDTQIADLEVRLAKVNDSIRLIVSQFNDSLVVLGRQKMEITAMKTEINTVYYAVGTYKELKKMGVLTKQGSFAGIGGAPELKQGFNVSYFTSALKPELKAIPLYSKFSKLVTNHPPDSYKVAGNGKTDSFIITDPASFWSTSKYLVILVNTQTSNNKAEVGEASITPPAE